MLRSERRLFKERGIKAAGNILPLSQTRLFRDIENLIPDPQRAEIVFRECNNKFLVNDIPVMPLSLYREMFINANRSRFESKYSYRRDAVIYLTLAEITERKGKFVEKVADAIWSILEETSWCLPAHQYTSRTNPYYTLPEKQDEEYIAALDIQTSQTCATLALARYFLKNELDNISPSICKRIDKQIYLRGIRPFVNGTFGWAGDYSNGQVSNWCTNITSNILLAAAVTAEDMNVREIVFDKALHNLDNFSASYAEDGSCAEGPAYWTGAAGCYFDALEIIEDMTDGKITIYDEPMVKEMGAFVSYMSIHDKWLVAFEDCHSKYAHSGDHIERFGKKCGSISLESFGHANAIGGNDVYYYYAFAYRWFKNYHTPLVTEKTKVIGKKSVWMFGCKIAVFRESTETDKGLFFATKGGSNGEPGNHNDVGCIVVFSNGKPVIVDAGIGSYNNDYFGKKRYERWYTNASYHSCPTFDGIDQKNNSNGMIYASKNEICDTERQTVSMDISGAYPEQAGVSELIRSSSLKDGIITISDEVHLDKEREMEFHLTSYAKPKLIKQGSLELADGRILTYDEDLNLNIERVENTKPFEDLSFRDAWGVECLWRVCLSVRAKDYTCHLTIS